MALKKITETYWYCAMCNYRMDAEPTLSNRCPACKDGDSKIYVYEPPRYDDVFFTGLEWLDKL